MHQWLYLLASPSKEVINCLVFERSILLLVLSYKSLNGFAKRRKTTQKHHLCYCLYNFKSRLEKISSQNGNASGWISIVYINLSRSVFLCIKNLGKDMVVYHKVTLRILLLKSFQGLMLICRLVVSLTQLWGQERWMFTPMG